MNTTRDTLWHGELVFTQPARGCGYRFNLDPILLASFVSPAEHAVDLGAGVGIIGILLLATGRARRVTAVEIQPQLAALARENAHANGLAGRLQVIEGDFREVSVTNADAVVFNPPYFRANEGHGALDNGRDAARHERHGTLADFAAWATATAGTGHIAAIVPAGRGEELERLLATATRPTCSRRRLVLPRAHSPAKHWLIEAAHSPSGAQAQPRLEPALVVHQASGRAFSDEVRQLLREP